VHTALLASSERDIVRALAERGAAALDERLDQTMTRSVVTCDGAMTVSEIIGWITAGRFRHVWILEVGRRPIRPNTRVVRVFDKEKHLIDDHHKLAAVERVGMRGYNIVGSARMLPRERQSLGAR
jgi:hypothetical protein